MIRKELRLGDMQKKLPIRVGRHRPQRQKFSIQPRVKVNPSVGLLHLGCLLCIQVRMEERMTKPFLFFLLTSVVYHRGWGEWRLGALQELLSHQTEKEGDGM